MIALLGAMVNIASRHVKRRMRVVREKSWIMVGSLKGDGIVVNGKLEDGITGFL
jgi:hypothetical protein